MNLLSLAFQITLKLKKIYLKVESLSREIRRLTQRLNSLENQLVSGLTVIPEFTKYFTNRIGQNVQIQTMLITLQGEVVSVADDGVQIRETSGDIVLIPFAKITSIQ